MKSLLSAALLLAPSAAPERLGFADAVVVKTWSGGSCGAVMSAAAIDFSYAGNVYRVYYECAEEEDLPREGARCTIDAHRGSVHGMTPYLAPAPSTANILDSMTCDPPAGAAHHDYSGVTIIGLGPMPKDNGDIGVHPRSVRVTTATGEVLTLYFLHSHRDANGTGIAELPKRRPYPAIGATCDISTSASLRYRASFRGKFPEELIYAVNCGR